MVFEFTLWLADDPRDIDEWSGALAEAGPTDCLAGIHCGALYVSFQREAPALEDAIRSARQQVRTAGLQVLRCEIEEEHMASFAR